MIILKHGNLLGSEAQTLVNTVNCVGIMGKGIALQFKEKFPYMFDTYLAQCKRGEIQPGQLTLHKNYHQWILNFPTKHHWKENSRLEYIEDGLKQLRHKYNEWGITSLAMPALGCGNGGLDWEIVRPLIIRYLGDINLQIEVFEPDPLIQGEDKAAQQIEMFGIISKPPKRKKRARKSP